jgi:phospholipid transport system substrate-binding protein
LSIEHARVILFLSALSIATGGWAQDADTKPGTTPAPPLSAEHGTENDAPGVAPDSSPDPATADDSAVAVVKQLNASLEKVLQEAEQLGYDGRLERLSPTLDAAFDFDYMAEKTVGRHWSTLSPEEQARWVDLFADLSKATYANRFDKYTGQTFEFVDSQPGASDTVIVRSKVVSPGEEDVNLSYRLSKTPAGWKVIDVYYKGTVSEVAMRRADYSSVAKNDGFEALVARVNEKIAQLRAGDETPE